MKKIMLLLAVLLSAAAVSSCGSTAAVNKTLSIDITDAAQTLSEKITFNDTLAKLPDDAVKASYKFDNSDETIVYTGSGATAEEIIICRAANADTLEALHKELEAYRDERISIYTDYNAEEVPKLRDAYIYSQDKYVFYIVSSDAASAADITMKFLNS